MDCYFSRPTSEQNPIERLKYLATGLVAGQHTSIVYLKDNAPIDPLLGETMYLEKPSQNTQMYFECVTADPQKVRYQYFNPHFRIEGSAWITVNVNPIANKAVGTRNGTNTITFSNGEQIELGLSKCELYGIMMGDLVNNFSGNYTMLDKTNNLICEVIYNPEYTKKSGIQKFTSGLKGMFGSKNKDRLSDDIELNIHSISFNTE